MDLVATFHSIPTLFQDSPWDLILPDIVPIPLTHPLSPIPRCSKQQLFILMAGCTIVLMVAGAVRRVRTVKPIVMVYPDRPAAVSMYGSKGMNSDMTCKDLVEKSCPSLQEGFKPSWWLFNGHLQTIYSAMANFDANDPVVYQRVLLRVPDGGTIGIDIYPPLNVNLTVNSPIVILNHGLTGGSHESYVRNMVISAARPVVEGGLGARVAVVNFRGCAGTPLTSPHLYSSGTTLDTHTATMYLSSLFPSSPILGIGFSLGAAVMTRYIGEQGDDCRIKAATVLCAPLELRGMSAKLDARQLFPKIYSYAMARKILRSISAHLFSDKPLCNPSSPLHQHLPTLRRMTNRYQWTLRASHVMELVVTKVGGSSDHFPFEGLEQFLEWACPGAWLKCIRRPTLALNAIDDPIVCGAAVECLPQQLVRNSTHLSLAAVPHGGHLAWFDGPFTGPDHHRRWHVRPVLEFLGAALDLEGPDLQPISVTRDGPWTCASDAKWQVVSA